MKYLGLLALLLAAAVIPAAASVDLFISPDPAFTVVDPGATLAVRFFVLNNGPDDAHATATVSLPQSVDVLSAEGAGWSCARQGSGEVVCTAVVPGRTSQPNGGGAPFTLTMRMPSSPDGFRIDGTATVSSAETDSTPSNNSVGFTVLVYRLLLVTTDADGGAGSLRSAIEAANANCRHTFDCKLAFSAPMTIAPSAPLPPITACGLLIDGGTLPSDPYDLGFDRPRRVELSGRNVTSGSGLEFRGQCAATATILGLAVNGFPENGILVRNSAPPLTSSDLILDGCFIGTDVTGTLARPNGWRGISVEGTPAVRVRRSEISGNGRSGIANWSSGYVEVTNSRVGASATGEVLPNGASGIFTNAGLLDVAQSIVAGNHEFGIAVGGDATSVVVFASFVDGNGGLGIDWGMDGPSTFAAPGRMPGVPRLTDAFYDVAKGQTIVRGVVTIDEKGTYAIDAYANGPTAAGYGGEERANAMVFLPQATAQQDATFEMTLRGDFRGRVITALTQRYVFLDLPSTASSEFSAGIRVR